MNFENWCNGEVSKSAKIWLLKYVKNHRNLSDFFFIEKYKFRITFFVILKLPYFLKWCPIFDSSPLLQFSKFNDFLCVCWILARNLSNFVSLSWNSTTSIVIVKVVYSEFGSFFRIYSGPDSGLLTYLFQCHCFHTYFTVVYWRIKKNDFMQKFSLEWKFHQDRFNNVPIWKRFEPWKMGRSIWLGFAEVCNSLDLLCERIGLYRYGGFCCLRDQRHTTGSGIIFFKSLLTRPQGYQGCRKIHQNILHNKTVEFLR